MADIDKLDSQLRALPNFAGLNITGSDTVKANYKLQWTVAPSAGTG